MAIENKEQPSLTDVNTLRKRARQHILKGAITAGYGADRDTVVKLLNTALATELICVLRYKRHYFMAHGLNAQNASAEFPEHANQELTHADQIATRIVQLGGNRIFHRMACRTGVTPSTLKENYWMK